MGDSNTEIILKHNEKQHTDGSIRPTVFVCEGHHIAEYRLEGLQNLGRPSDKTMPEIPAYSRFVSRNHGIFETNGIETTFTAINTTNGIMHKGKILDPWQKVMLRDGYELTIPSGDESVNPVLVIYACSPERIQFWRKLQEASRDKLTGLCDRDSFMTWWKQNYRNKDYENVILFILDIDSFKEINDKNGHNAGDDSLRVVADTLRHLVRYENQVCRWGGDEFVGIIPATSENADERLEELSSRIREASADFGIPLSVTIGYVDMHIAKDILDIPGIVGMADKALYQAKTTQKGVINGYRNG